MSSRILILFAHPSQHCSEVNLPLLRASTAVDGVSVVDLYGEYPNFDIDIDREQARLRAHDLIVFMFPMYWYSTPAILKEWQDLVLEYGFAYGQGGSALHDKALLCALSAGGAEDAYRAGGYNQFSLRELLRPLEQTANLCGMTWLPPYALFDSRTALAAGKVARHIDDWIRLLECLRDGRLDRDRAAVAEHLADCIALAERARA